MTSRKATLALSGVLVLIVVGGVGLFYVGDKMLQKKSEEISQEKIQLEAVKTELSIFKTSKEMVEKYGFVNELTGKILPDSKFQSEVVAELTKFANQSNMKIQTLSFGAGNDADADANLSQTQTITGLSGVRVLNASIQFSSDPAISYTNFLNFLKSIESNQRKMQVATLSLTPDPENSQQISSATVTVNIFLKDSAPAPTEEETN